MSVDVNKAIEMLNSMIKADKEAVKTLIQHRVGCNQDMANHPTVQVSVVGSKYKVGLLGVINGIFGADANGIGYIAAVYDDNGELIRFDKFKVE